MKVHKVILSIVDMDDIGADEVRDVIENVKYPNRCIHPSVVSIKTREVEWSDDHPLNKGDTFRDEFDRLFATPGAGGA